MENVMDVSLRTAAADGGCEKERSNDWMYTRDKKSLLDEISQFSAAKQDKLMKNREPNAWRIEIQEQIEQEIAKRVREALDTPPLERIRRNKEKAKIRRLQQVEHANRSHSVTTAEELKAQKTRKRNKKKRPPYRRLAASTTIRATERTSDDEEDNNKNLMGKSNHYKHFDQNLNWTNTNTKSAVLSPQVLKKPMLITTTAVTDTTEHQDTTTTPKSDTVHTNCYTKKGFQNYQSKNKKMKEWVRDENGVLLTVDGPFWPPEYTPVVPKPLHILQLPKNYELLSDSVPQKSRTVNNQRTKWFRPWEGSLMIYDSERSSRVNTSLDVPDGCCSSLLFESRFESGNLRQAKRVGQFEYELILKTDLYTNRHTQWYYFRIQNMIPGVTYKFSIINLLKRDSLYNHGMRPLLYSEKNAELKGVGWIRSGHHISYSRNYSNTRNPLLHPDMSYYLLEWQMEFEHEDDTCYLAHCYPFTFTDLKEHIDSIISDPIRGRYLQREVMCETRAGNSCFLLTISSNNEDVEDANKKGVVITARVHPGETNSSWIMKGVIDFLTSTNQDAQELRKNFIFKIVPMLNPDGVIVGNYRCSLAARDLNRNYRNPRKESFPTIWHTKNMLETFSRQREVLVYCDLHGHSRKHNVFIYGCDSKGTQADPGNFLCLRLFPWLMSRKAPDKFTFRGCKFQVRKCKESTGRVVMWRQLGIANSFTLEATFCGSKNIAFSSRHFNIKDFEELGQQFGQVILQYHTAKNNQSLHSELILEMTRDITHQVLQGRGMMPNQLINYSKGGTKSTIDKENELTDNQVKKEDMNALIQQITEETFEGCIGILQDLDAIQEFEESDTSDSDSGSDSEMLASQITGDTHTKSKSKKHSKNRAKSIPTLPALSRSGNKQRIKKGDKLRHTIENTEAVKEEISQKISDQLNDSLPRLPPHKLICISQRQNILEESRLRKNYVTRIEPQNMTITSEVQGRLPVDSANYWKNALDFSYHSTKQNTNSVRASNGFVKPKYPAFVNRYIGRSNGGIPIYTTERIGERAAKRMESAINASDVGGKDLSKEEEYARLVALTRELQIRTEETPYKLTERNNLDIPPAGPVLIRQSYTHAGPGVLRGPQALVQDPAKLSSNSSDKTESIKLHNVMLNKQIEHDNLISSDHKSFKTSSRNKKNTSPSDFTEKMLRPNSFIGCSKDTSDICPCFECQEVKHCSTNNTKTARSQSYKEQWFNSKRHSKEENDNVTKSAWAQQSSTDNSSSQGAKNIHLIKTQNSVCVRNDQLQIASAPSRYIHGISKELLE